MRKKLLFLIALSCYLHSYAQTPAADTFLKFLKAQSQLIYSAKMTSRGELTAGTAHEIQNPLNFVHNFSGLEMIVETTKEKDLNLFNCYYHQ